MKSLTIGKLISALAGQGALVGAAAVVVGAGTLIGSGTLAGFQAQTDNPGTAFAAGILRMSNIAGTAIGTNADCSVDGSTTGVLSGTCSTLFSSSALHVPGDVSSNTVKIKNVGNVPGSLALSFTGVSAETNSTATGAPACGATSTYLSKMAVEVLDGTTSVATGTLAALPTWNNATFNAADEKTYTVKLTFTATDTATDNTLQNCKANFGLRWTLAQRSATTSTAGA
jgi:hypothetical protein